ncbi:unnamed protein product [Adineta steineri]|uniref:Ig-like domain-containing protein n=1 Tax=Adineta steineri TaxID=433720 RepID=A0A818JXC8_9BILA|nr:unnamed protein product [Adineta steineri]CAF3546782.1 unnamed protein product [Adineta steineri]
MAKSTKTDTGELFLSRLSETYICRPGDNILLECYVRHQRVKAVVWYANGELVEVRGFRMWHRYTPATGLCALYIRSVLYTDEGSYCCQAIGLDNTTELLHVKIQIDNSDKAWTKIPILHMAGHISPEDEDESKTIFVTPTNQNTIINDNMFPIHWYELRLDRALPDPIIITENHPLQLSCRIAGLHIEKFEWYRNGELVSVSNDSPPSSLVTNTITSDVDRGQFHTSYDTLPNHFIPLLTVDRTSKYRHEGTYECHASNAHYSVSSSCNVIINEVEQKQISTDELISSQSIFDTKKRPEIDRQEQLSTIDRKRLRLDESTVGHQIFQSHQPLSSSPVESPFRTIGDQLVPSTEAKKDQTKAIKWSEQVQTFARNELPMELNTLLAPIPEVVPSSSSDDSTSISTRNVEHARHSQAIISTYPTTATSHSSDIVNETIGMCPVFFQLLPSNIECEEGERLLLSCQVMAGTQCQIKWLNNQIIISENAYRTRRHYNPDTGICFIIIDPTQTTDSGLYRLIISNQHGQVESTCQVKILIRQLPPMPEDDVSTHLYFIKPLSTIPITCRDGDTIQLTCVVHGRRPIYIRWFKDEQQIFINDKQQHTRQINFDPLTGKSTLTMNDIYPTDSGIYRCEANNEQEKTSTSTTVDVIHYQYEVDSDRSSLSYVSGPPSDHEDATESQITYDKAVYEESRRLTKELDARIADLSSGNITTIADGQKPGNIYIFLI